MPKSSHHQATSRLPDVETLQLHANGLTLHAVAAGPADGPLAILLHGFPEFWYGWRHQLGPLASAGLRVVALDQRGYGQSDKPAGRQAYVLDTLADDVLGVADALGHERFAVVGHDWGGIVTWHLAGRNPDRIERAAVLNAPHPATVGRHMLTHPDQVARSAYVAFFQLPLLPEWALGAAGFASLRRTLVTTARPGSFTEDDLDRYRQAWAQPGALTAMLNWYRALPMQSFPSTPERIRVPVRVVWGDRDVALQRGLAEAGVALCDHGEVFHLPEATHWVQHDEAERVGRLLVEFLA